MRGRTVAFPGTQTDLIPRQPRNLPFISLGPLFMGRNPDLDRLRLALATGQGAAVVGRALHGLGGVGKTRLAVEYALRHETDYSALLFLRADDSATLASNFAALAGTDVLDLPEKEAREDETKIAAVNRWLEAHPPWLLILDNVDDEEAVSAVCRLMTRLNGGHVVVTARASNFPASFRKLELDVLDPEAATEFLLERTRDERALAADDNERAREIARELGGLALGLEQAGAYIAVERIGFARYLALWRESRQQVIDWFDQTLMSYSHDVGLAATWTTSVNRLSPVSRRLLERLAMLAPDPIPDSLLDVTVPSEVSGFDARTARRSLFAYSLATREKGEVGERFLIHRLVQDFARRGMTKAISKQTIRDAVGWISAAFADDPQEVRNWLVLDSVAPHALAVARRADEAKIADFSKHFFDQLAMLAHRIVEGRLIWLMTIERPNSPPRRATIWLRKASSWLGTSIVGIAKPTAQLFDQLAILSFAKARYAEAEQLYCRALAIDELLYGLTHPNVSRDLGNLAFLLQVRSRFEEAERMFRRALQIEKKALGTNHSIVANALGDLARLLKDTNRHAEAEDLFRQALKFKQKLYGEVDPRVVKDLSNLALLLKDTNRAAEAEPLFRQALKIIEVSPKPDQSEVAESCNNLAVVLRDLNLYAEAELFHRRALATDLNLVAALLHSTGRTEEAEPLFRQALAIDESKYGPDHVFVARDVRDLAFILAQDRKIY